MLYNYIFICLEGSWSIVISGHSNSRKLRERERDYCVCVTNVTQSQVSPDFGALRAEAVADLQALATWHGGHRNASWSCWAACCSSTLYCLFCRILRWNWESMSTMECLWCLWVPCGCNFGLKWAEQLQYTLDIRVSRMPLDRRQGVILTTYYILQDHETPAGNPKDWRFQVMIRPDPCSRDMFVPSWFFRTKAIQSHKK